MAIETRSSASVAPEGVPCSVEEAWALFSESGRIASGVLRPEIEASWRRCRDGGLDPRASKRPVYLSEDELESRKRANAILTETALPFMESLCGSLQHSGVILALTDADAVVLQVFGDKQTLELARGNNYVPGCVRSEGTVGTNAICLALAERRPIQLSGAEHYTIGHHSWRCAAAPIFGADGAVLGTIALTGAMTEEHRLLLGLVVSAAEAIHDRMSEGEVRRLNARASSVLSSVLDSISEPIITIDSSGLVTNVNPAAARLLGIRPERALNKSVLKILPGSPELADVLIKREESGPIGVDAAGDGARLVATPYFMRTDGIAHGAVLILRPLKQHVEGVRTLTGFTASFRFEDIIGRSPKLLQQIDLASKAAKEDARILITGETGTGKELFAQSVHNASPRRRGPFVALNCAAIPRELLESELFGYKGGAFTGSRKSGQVGKFELADGGTLFLDEINSLPFDLQSKLLRTLQDGTVTRLGDSSPKRVDVRVVAASNEDLYELSRTNGFRMDLYFRLSVVEIHLPPLRERQEDIPLMAEHILAAIASRTGRPPMKVSLAAMDLMKRYPWIGNVRELENVLEMAAIVCSGDTLELEDVALRMKELPPVSRDVPAAISTDRPVRDAELALIHGAMREHGNNIAQVARALRISRSTIYRRLQGAGIPLPDRSDRRDRDRA